MNKAQGWLYIQYVVFEGTCQLVERAVVCSMFAPLNLGPDIPPSSPNWLISTI